MDDRKRLIQSMEFDELSVNQVDDQYFQSNTIDWHNTSESGKHILEFLVHGFEGPSNHKSFSEFYISGSHKHPKFFELFATYHDEFRMKKFESTITWFPRLKMSTVNSVLQDIKSGESKQGVSKFIKDRLSQSELNSLPIEFSVFMLPVDKFSLTIIHPSVIRKVCLDSSDLLRWKFLFKCRSLNGDKLDKLDELPSFPSSKYARKYEEKLNKNISGFFPYRMKTPSNENLEEFIRCNMDKHGVMLFPLDGVFVMDYIYKVKKYMYFLMRCDFEKIPLFSDKYSPYHYRNLSKMSKHIPKWHGRTRYGHFCSDLKALCVQIEPVIRSAFQSIYPEDRDVYACTSEIIIQHA